MSQEAWQEAAKASSETRLKGEGLQGEEPFEGVYLSGKETLTWERTKHM